MSTDPTPPRPAVEEVDTPALRLARALGTAPAAAEPDAEPTREPEPLA